MSLRIRLQLERARRERLQLVMQLLAARQAEARRSAGPAAKPARDPERRKVPR